MTAMFTAGPSQLKIVQFNVENLFIYMDLYEGQDLSSMDQKNWKQVSGSSTPNKPIHKIRALANSIEDMSPDIVGLNEVGGEESLRNFNKYFLNEAYEVHIKEGNSLRGIDVGYLVKKNLGLKPLLLSHKNRPIDFLYPHEEATASGGKSHYFSRDVLELRLFEPGKNSPGLVLLLTHLKSKLDSDGVDFEGRLRRHAELKTLVKIYNEVRKELGSEAGLLVLGDLNGVARKGVHEAEFNELHSDTDLIDSFTLLNMEESQKLSQVQIDRDGKQNVMQIDYIFVSPNLADHVKEDEGGPYFYKTELGNEAPLPKNLEERDRLPSDHYPVRITLQF